MAEIFYNKYTLKLKGEKYEILIPKISLDEAWLFPKIKSYYDSTYIQGNRDLLLNLWNALVTLTFERQSIIYFPIKKNRMFMSKDNRDDNFDLVFYNRQNRSVKKHWKRLRRMMRYIEPYEFVVSYEVADFLKKCRRKWEDIRRNGRYYSRKWYPREWILRSERVFFMEGSVGLNIENVDVIHEFMQRDLEEEMFLPDRTFPSVGILGMQYCFITKDGYEKKLKMRLEEKFKQEGLKDDK